MGSSLSLLQDSANGIATWLNLTDVSHTFMACQYLKGFDNDSMWSMLYNAHFKRAFSPNQPKIAFELIFRNHKLRFDQMQTFGGHLYCDDSLFITDGSREAGIPRLYSFISDSDGNMVYYDTTPDFKPLPGTNGWRLSRFTQPLLHGPRFYWEIKMIWINPDYGDIFVGVSDISTGKQGNNQSVLDTCCSYGIHYSAAGKTAHLVSGETSSWDLGPAGPKGIELNSIKAMLNHDEDDNDNNDDDDGQNVQFVISCMYDRDAASLEFAFNGEMICGKLEPDIEITKFHPSVVLVPVVLMYSGGANCQILRIWEHQELAEKFLLS